MSQLSAGYDAFDHCTDEHDNRTAARFANAQQLAFDGEGRILLPESLTTHAGITDQAAFVGRGPLFEIWHPERFQDYQAEAVMRAAERGMTLRPGMAPPGETGGQT